MTTTEVPSETTLSPRLQQFQTEVDNLKVTGGKAGPERSGRILGGVLMLAGIVVCIVSYFMSHGVSDPPSLNDALTVGMIGIALSVVGTGIFVVFSLTRYFRYWLVRLVYETREQTDALRAR